MRVRVWVTAIRIKSMDKVSDALAQDLTEPRSVKEKRHSNFYTSTQDYLGGLKNTI